MGFKCISTFLAAATLSLAQPVAAEPLAFGPDLARAGWTVVRFPRIPPASFQVGDAMTLEIATNAVAGLLWRKIKPNARKSNKAQWSWWVDEGVPLVYVLGGDKPRGTTLPSPYMGSRGKFMVLRPASVPKGTWFDEGVDLAGDYRRAFGAKPPLLLAVAISSDSDDTGGRNRAKLRNLSIGD